MSNQANRAALFGGKASGAAANKPVSVTAAKPSSTTAKANDVLIEPIKPVSKTAGITPSNQPKTQSSGITLSAEARRKKQEEIQQLLERANTALKTTMFQWSPDYLVAAPLFEQAAEIYKQLGDLPKAIEFFQKAAEAHEKCKAISSAALALTKAANIAVDNNIDTDAPRLLQGVAEYWAAYGDLTRYGETVHKLGKQLEARLPKKAKEYHWQAIRALVPDETPKEQLASTPAIIFDMTRSVLTFFIQQQYWSDAIQLTKRMADIAQAFQMDSTFHKSLATETFLTLIMTADVLQAQQVHLGHFNHADYLASKECEVADLFIVAIQTQDSDKFDEARRHPQLNYFDAQLAQLLRYQLSLENLVEGVSPFVSRTTPSAASATNVSKKTAAAATTDSSFPSHGPSARSLFGASAAASSSSNSSSNKPSAAAPVPSPPTDNNNNSSSNNNNSSSSSKQLAKDTQVVPPTPPTPLPIVTDTVEGGVSGKESSDNEEEEEEEEEAMDLTELESQLAGDATHNEEVPVAAEHDTAGAAPATPAVPVTSDATPAAAHEEDDDDLAFLA